MSNTFWNLFILPADLPFVRSPGLDAAMEVNKPGSRSLSQWRATFSSCENEDREPRLINAG